MPSRKRTVVAGTMLVGGAAAGLAAAVFIATTQVRGADHGDAPIVRSDTRLDVNDVYLFASPETPANTVMVMTVCPLAGVTGPKLFADKASYQIAIDTTGDAIEDQVYSLTFKKPDAAGKQSFKLTGPDKVKGEGTTDTTATFGTGGKVFAGFLDDPFFFDLIGFKRGLAFSAETSRNFFDGLNTMAIVIEVPTSSFGTLANDTMGIWARTLRGKKQIDRMGRPAINTVLIGAADKDAFNATSPRDDVTRWKAMVKANLMAAPLSRTDADAEGLVNVLLPDVLTYKPSVPDGFLNGRKLTDDVIDAELALLSNGVVTTDFVASDNTFRATFPYLGTPNP